MQSRTHHLLEKAAELYPFDAHTLRLIRSSVFSPNDVYAFARGDREYILRIATHDDDHTALTCAEMDWLSHLHREGVPVSMPLPMRDGRLVAALRHGDKHHAVCAFEKAEGAMPSRDDPALWNMDICRDWGYTLGRIHRATKTYRPSDPKCTRPVFDGAEALHPALKELPAIDALAHDLVKSLLALPQTPDTYGLIHNDFHHTNFFVNRGRVHVFDFDDSMYGHFALDVGVSLYFALRWGLPDNAAQRQAQAERTVATFLEGYSAANSLDQEARASIPAFMRYRQLCDFGWVYDPVSRPMLDEQHNLLHEIAVPGVRLTAEMFA